MTPTGARYHFLAMNPAPQLTGRYCYSLNESDFVWTQGSDWSLIILTHPGLFVMGARTNAHGAHTVFLVPPGTRCRLQPAPAAEPVAIWFRFEPAAVPGPIVAVPFRSDLEEEGPFWEKRLRTALNRSYAMDGEIQIAFADLLWSLSDDPARVRQSPALEAAERFIEDHIGAPIRVERLADAVEVSHNHLIRLFKQEHGVTPIEYIRLRRQHHACRLLVESSLPIKQIAAAVGMSDLAQFNHLVHGASGMSPREFRASCRPPDLFRAQLPRRPEVD